MDGSAANCGENDKFHDAVVGMIRNLGCYTMATKKKS